MIRALLRRLHHGQGGYTLAEVVAATVILGIIALPLGAAMVVGYRTVFGIQERLANTADVAKLSTYFPQDVASVDADGVNPIRVEDEGICKASPTEQSLITFRWDSDLGDNGQTVVRYLAKGAGSDSKIVRRICRGTAAPVETVLASHFGEAGGPEAAEYLTAPGHPDITTPVCGTRLCYLDINGAYTYHLDAQRRVEGDSGTQKPPGAPTNVHALSGFERARLFWTDPADTSGLPITGYYVEIYNVGIVGGATPTLFPPGSGNPPGAVIAPLTNYTSYQFRVRAVTIVGNGPWSDWSNSVTPSPTTPEPPTIGTATGSTSVNGQIDATWSLSADYSNGGVPLTGYRLTVLSPDATPSSTAILNPAATSGSITGLQDNTRYSVQVSATNSYGEGSPSQAITAVLTLPGPPATPVAAGSGTAGTVVLTFTPPADGDFAEFTNFRAKVGSTFTTPVAAATACPTSSSCTLTVSGVNVSSSTAVQVQAQNATGWGRLSSTLTIAADTAAPTAAITFPANPTYGQNAWNAGCSGAGGVCGTAMDGPPGGVASVSYTVRRSSDNRYWNGTTGTSTSQWTTSANNLAATGTTSWARALTTGSLQNGVTYTITATAKDTVNLSSAPVTQSFTYVTNAPTVTLTVPANNARITGSATVTATASATSPATIASVLFEYRTATSGTWTAIATPTASPYTSAWDTTGLADGQYNVRATATDSAGNVSSTGDTSVTVTVDNTPPTGELTAPTNGAFVRGTIAVSSNSTDGAGSGVASATFQRSPAGANTWTTIGSPDTTSPYSVNWNTTGVTDGAYDLRVVTTDNMAFTYASAIVTVTVDNTKPVITPTVVGTLGANGWYTSNVAVTWAVNDALSGIASTTGCGNQNVTADTTGVTYTCSATDNAGNSENQSVTIKRDATNPTGTLTAPTAGATVAGTIAVSSNSADATSGVANATFQSSPAGANTWTTIGSPDTTSPYSVNWNTSALAQGSYDLRVVTTDNAGLTFTSAVRTVYVDSTKPTLVITFPDDGSSYNAAAWNATCATGVCGTAADTAPGSVASVSLTIRRSSDNRYWNGSAGTTTTQWSSTSAINLAATGTTSWTRALTTASLQDGVTYTIVANATDAAGNVSDPVTAVFKYDTTAPTGSVTAPANSANVTDTVAVTSNSADSFSGVASAKFEYRVATSGAWTTIGTATTSPWSVNWDTTAVADGQYYLHVITTDNAGNTTTSPDTSVRVRVDNTLPTGAITAPTNGANVRGSSVSVTSNSADGGSGVASATFQRSPSGANTWTTIGTATGPYSVTWNTTSGTPDGLYDLRVTTTDNAGNTFTSPTITVRVDNTVPTVGAAVVTGTIGANGWYTSNVSVTWPAPTDSGSGIASTTGCGATNVTTDTTGTTLTCSATDNAGNTASQSVTIKRDATNPTGSLTAPAGGASVTGTTVAVSSNSADATSGVANATFQYSPAGAGTWTTIGSPDTTSPYSVNWNVNALPQGNYDLRVVTADNAGNSFTSPTITVGSDNTPPTVAITFPTDGSSYNAAAWNATCATGVCGTAADTAPGSVASVSLTVRRSSDNRYWNGSAGTTTTQWSSTSAINLAATGTTSWTRALTTASLQDGVTYTIVATATDGVGLTGTDTAVFKYDTTAPTGSVTAPANSANVTDTVAVTSNSADSFSGVASAKFEYRVATSGAWTTIGTATTSPWSVDWDTTAVADGQYYLHVITTDNAGNTTTSADTSVRVRVDNTLPTGAITAPTNGANVRGSSVTVSSNSADGGSGVANATFQRSPMGANTWTTIGSPDTTSPYSVTWNTTTLTDGDYDLRVVTTDNAGNAFTSPTITVTVDNTAPTITPSVTGTLGSNGWYTSNVGVTWTVTDDGSGVNAGTLSGCGTTTVTSNTTGQVVTCSGSDNAGNTASQSVTIKRDATNPTGSLTAPAGGATVTGTTVAVSSNSADATSGVANATFQYSPAGANTWTTIGSPDTTSPYSVNWNVNALPQGNYDLRVVTTDNAGLTFTSSTLTVSVDNTAPTVAITFPTDGSSYNAAAWNATCATGVCGTAADTAPGSVASVSLTIRRSSDNRYWNGSAGTTTTQWSSTSAINLAATGTTSWTRALTTASLQNGVTYTIVATATDGVGLTGTDTAVFKYDTTAPTGSVTAPANSANVSDTVAVTSNSADSFSGVASAMFEYRVATSGAWTTIGTATTSPWSVDWDTTAVADGQYYLHVVTTDNAGNTTTSADTSVRVRVDNTLPTGAITAPTNGANVRGSSVAVSSNSADGGSGVANATFQRSPMGANTWTTIGSPDTTSPYSVTWDTTAVADGQYDLRVVTTDNAGNAFTSPTITVRVDNTAPSIVGNATGTVGSNGWYTTNVGLTWTVTDPGSGVATQTNCGAQSVTSDTTGTSFTCSATDNAGNSGSGTVTIKRDTVNPTGAITAPAASARVGGSSVAITSSSADATSGVASAVFQRSPAGTNTWTTIATDTSSPWTTTWNTTALANGNYDLRVVTTDNAGLTFTSPSVTVTVDNTKPVPTGLTLNNGSGQTLGQVNNGDYVTITYSEALDVNSICSQWSGSGDKSLTGVTVTMSTSDVLTFANSSCTAGLDIGSVTTNGNYNSSSSSSRTWSSSTVTWTAATNTLTITLGTGSGGTAATGVSASTPTYTPDTNIADLAGNTMNNTTFSAPSTSRF